MQQLRKDISKTFETARDKVAAHASAREDLTGELRRWIDSATRFIEPNATIRDRHRLVSELADALVGLMAEVPRPNSYFIGTAKADLLSALDDLQEAILKHGILTPGGEKVGLGLAGRSI